VPHGEKVRVGQREEALCALGQVVERAEEESCGGDALARPRALAGEAALVEAAPPAAQGAEAQDLARRDPVAQRACFSVQASKRSRLGSASAP
jgi:hypothetical protein